MDPGTVVLLHSPLVGVESRGAVPEALRRGGAVEPLVPDPAARAALLARM